MRSNFVPWGMVLRDSLRIVIWIGGVDVVVELVVEYEGQYLGRASLNAVMNFFSRQRRIISGISWSGILEVVVCWMLFGSGREDVISNRRGRAYLHT